MKKPIVIVNFKTYKQGKEVIKLARAVERVNGKIIVGVQASDVYEVVKKTRLRVYVQHVDYFEKGRNTGYVLPEAVKRDGAKGVFLNHSEHRLKFDVLKKSVKRCREVGLKVVVFASGLEMAKRVKKLRVDYIIIEPVELVGSGKSVSEERPELIEKVAKGLKCKFLVGAGIHSKEDVEVAMKLGASGIAVSSAVVKARSPYNVLKGLVGG